VYGARRRQGEQTETSKLKHGGEARSRMRPRGHARGSWNNSKCRMKGAIEERPDEEVGGARRLSGMMVQREVQVPRKEVD
jgi:hypothetical protein